MRILGISAYHQDSAAAVLVDGRPVAGAHEGLFTKTPLDASLPLRAARDCLARAGLTGPDLDSVVFYEKPLRRFERLLLMALRGFPRAGRPFAREMSLWLGDKLWLKGRLADELGVASERVHFVEHLASHAATAFHLSPFARAAVLVVDDVGEWATTAIFRGTPAGLEPLGEAHLPHSFGLAASAFAQFLGFDPGKDDIGLQDLARWGKPRWTEEVARVIGSAADGSPQIDSATLRLGDSGARLWTDAFEERFGASRVPGSPLRMAGDDARDADLAASLQAVLEERVVALARVACERAGESALCFAGVLAHNRGVNRALLASGIRELFVPCDPSDAGGALGAALLAHHAATGGNGSNSYGERRPSRAALFLGDVPGEHSLEGAHERSRSAPSLVPALAAGEVVAWVRGALEFAGESLFHRCAFASPGLADGRERLLGALQRPEPFHSCRLALPVERVAEFVELPAGGEHMVRAAQLQLPARAALRSVAPAALAPDGSVRVQAVASDDDPEFHALLLAFAAASGVPGLLVETFRLRGGVIPRFDHEALEAFRRTTLSALLIEDRLYRAAGD